MSHQPAAFYFNHITGEGENAEGNGIHRHDTDPSAPPAPYGDGYAPPPAYQEEYLQNSEKTRLIKDTIVEYTAAASIKDKGIIDNYQLIDLSGDGIPTSIYLATPPQPPVYLDDAKQPLEQPQIQQNPFAQWRQNNTTTIVIHHYHAPQPVMTFWDWFWFFRIMEWSHHNHQYEHNHRQENDDDACKNFLIGLAILLIILLATVCFVYVIGQLAHAFDHLTRGEQILKSILNILVITAALCLGVAFGPAIFAAIFGTLIAATTGIALGVLLTPFIFAAAGLLVTSGIWNIGGLIASCFVKGPVADSTQPFQTRPNDIGVAHMLDGLASVYYYSPENKTKIADVAPPGYGSEDSSNIISYSGQEIEDNKTRLVDSIRQLKYQTHDQQSFTSIVASCFPNTDASLQMAFIDMMAKKILKGEAEQTVVTTSTEKTFLLYTLSKGKIDQERYGDLVGLAHDPKEDKWQLVKKVNSRSWSF